ncbi:MAG: LamG-like jellyroll fold domain-containing protein, partial [Armatimonadota bacterium]
MSAHCSATLVTGLLMGALCTAGTAGETVGYWPLDEGQGILAHDRAQASNDAIIYGPQWAEGHEGGGLRFGGTDADDYLVIAHDPALQLADGFTVQLWWLKEGGGVQILEGALHFSVVASDGQSHAIEAPAPPDGWHHLAFTCGEGTMAIIIDGETLASGRPPDIGLMPTGAPLLIGTYSPGYRYCLGGVIDDLCIFDRPLPPEQLRAELDRARTLAATRTAARRFEPEHGGLVLAKDGAPGATIVIPDDASPLQLQP